MWLAINKASVSCTEEDAWTKANNENILKLSFANKLNDKIKVIILFYFINILLWGLDYGKDRHLCF